MLREVKTERVFVPDEPRPSVRPCDLELARLSALLNQGQRVTILAGAGCAGAHAELVLLADALKAPIVHALRGKEYVEYDNPFDVGMTGLLGFASGYYAMLDCDVLLVLGSDLPYPQFYPERAQVAQVDIRPENLGRRARLDLGLVGDVKSTLDALLPLLENKLEQQHLDRAVLHYRKSRRSLDELATGTPGRKPIHPQYLTRVVDELAAPDAIFTCDVGSPTLWAARYLTMNGKRRLLGSFSHGSMASANPDFAALARAAGIHGVRVEDPGELPGAVEASLRHDGPSLIDVVVNRQELAIPPAIKFAQAKGFTLHMLSAILNGRGDEIIELARTNLWR
jgi:thiamine pyrophosphate-dependent acetolactate synthase large subunit-like protein